MCKLVMITDLSLVLTGGICSMNSLIAFYLHNKVQNNHKCSISSSIAIADLHVAPIFFILQRTMGGVLNNYS